MEIKSIKGLIEVAERTENVCNRIRALNMTDHDVGIPAVPLPLSLEATEAWVQLATECCRKPLLARSRQLLEAKGIATETIPAAVLEKPDSIAYLLQRVDRLHEGLHAGAFESVARALTKGIDDAESVVTTFIGASNGLNTLEGSEGWVVALAAARIVEAPSKAGAVVEIARRVIGHFNAAAGKGVEIRPFLSLEDALTNLTRLNALNQEHDGLLASEGLSEECVPLTGLSVQEAVNKLTLAMGNTRSEKTKLAQEAQTLQSQLELIGGESRGTASTIAELRRLVPRLQELLEERRRIFRTSLGPTAFHVVESLTEGKLPAENVSDEELGKAIRKAIECGYRFQLEAPRENR